MQHIKEALISTDYTFEEALINAVDYAKYVYMYVIVWHFLSSPA